MDIKFSTGVIAFILALNLSTMNVFAGKPKYIEDEVSSGGSISGTVKYKGPPKDVRIDLMKEKNGETCSKHPEAKDGVRFDRKILSPDGWLQNAVVFIENIEHGKTWGTNYGGTEGGESGFTRFHFKNCGISPPIILVRNRQRRNKLATRP